MPEQPVTQLVVVSDDAGHSLSAARPFTNGEEIPGVHGKIMIEELGRTLRIERYDRGAAYAFARPTEVATLINEHRWIAPVIGIAA